MFISAVSLFLNPDWFLSFSAARIDVPVEQEVNTFNINSITNVSNVKGNVSTMNIHKVKSEEDDAKDFPTGKYQIN